MSTERRLSIESPSLRRRWPTPPCRVRPAIPVVETTPPGTASPKSCASRSVSPQVAPPCARTVCVEGSTWTPRICERSITRPPSLTALPATLWPPPLIETSRFCSRAKLTASTTSAAPLHCTISAGRRSINRSAQPLLEGLGRFRVECGFGRRLACHRFLLSVSAPEDTRTNEDLKAD